MTLGTHHSGAWSTDFLCAIKVLLEPSSTHTPLTYTVHMPVMENADRLTGRRIQAVMREWSQGGGGLGVRTTGRWGRGGRPSYLEIFQPQSSAALAWWGREIKVQGLVTGQGGGGGGGWAALHPELSLGFRASRFWAEPQPERGTLWLSIWGLRDLLKCHRRAETLGQGCNIWKESRAPRPEGHRLGEGWS